MSRGVRIVALSCGMDPDQPPSMLYTALRVRRAEQMRMERDRATLLYNAVCFGLSHGKDLTYWDVAGHLYPPDFVKRKREEIMINRQRAQQMEELEAIRQFMMVKQEEERARRDKHA